MCGRNHYQAIEEELCKLCARLQLLYFSHYLPPEM